VKAKKPKGGLLLDSKDGVRKGGDSGPAIVPGEPEKSLLVQAVRHTDKDRKMPPDKKLPAAMIADLETWVKRGAADPRTKPPIFLAPTPWEEVFKERKRWWSLQPVRKPELPQVKDSKWSPEPIDRFVLAGLEKAGLLPGGDAAPRALIRRLSLVLTGLPPTVEEVERFCAKPQARLEETVDRLLASPHFGERWARHWMDVVRFAETHGNEWNYEVHHAWRYRDYLIRAFNEDVPFDRLAMEHIAGDLLPPRWNRAPLSPGGRGARGEGEAKFNESLIGTAFWRFGEVNHDDCVEFRQIGYDLFDNQIDTLGKAFLATTIACARCHEHKLDAISMKDYYAILGILRSSRLVSHTIDAPEANAKAKERLRELKPQIKAELAKKWLEDARSVSKYFRAAADEAEQTKGLDTARLEKWRKALGGKADLDDIGQPWRLLSGKQGAEFNAAWDELVREYAVEQEKRAEFNAKNFIRFDTWQGGGQGLADGAGSVGEIAVECQGDGAVVGVYPAGYYTNGLSSKLNGTLRSPQLPVGKKYISFQALGNKTAAVRLVSNNCQLDYIHYRALTKNEWSWFKLKIPADAESLRTYAELMTKFDNPKFPDQLGTLGGDDHNDRIPWEKAAADSRSFFGLARAVVHDTDELPRAELTHLKPLLAIPLKSAQDLADRYAEVVELAIRAWANGKATEDDVRWIDWLLKRGLLTNDRKATPKLDALVTEYRETEKQVAMPRIIPGIADAPTAYDQPLLARGDLTKPGAAIARRFLEVLETPPTTFAAKGSGRLELAQRIASPSNPLTTRVFVNRVWHHLFGAGLVRTVDDFGHLGDQPSHPELLDYLAATFVEDGWSIKKLIRRIVLSRTFQMMATADAKASVVDPDNRLLHHYPARRLEAEAIRDAILAASGRLDRTLYGHSIDPWRDKANPDRRLFPGPLDGNGRRSIYIKVNLMEPPRFLGAFDFPGGKVTRGRRDVTNVPAQALALLNDPFVLQQAEFWADRLVKQGDATVGARIERMFHTALGRPPDAEERERFERLVTQLAGLHEVAQDGVLGNRAVWRDVGHAFFNLKEFIYIP
jgi:hypothetical protein